MVIKRHVSLYIHTHTYLPQFNKTVNLNLNFFWLGKVQKSVFISLRHAFPLVLAVLVLAEIELIFFIVARAGLQFGFVLKTVLIRQGRLSYC